MNSLGFPPVDISVFDARPRASRRPPIAVLIPCFNAEDVVPRALASLAANSEPHDIILVDDGSKRPLAGMLSNVPTNAVVVRLERNVGIVGALNAGLKFIAAEGYTYAARLDADDWSTPERLSKQARFLDDHKEVALLGSWANIVDENGNFLVRSEPSAEATKLRRALAYRNPIVHSTFMLRVADVVASGGYDRRYQGSEDYELIRRLARVDAVAILPEPLTFFQVTSGGISSKRLAQVRTDIKVKLTHLSPLSIHAYLGLTKTTLSALLSRGAILRAHQLAVQFRALCGARAR